MKSPSEPTIRGEPLLAVAIALPGWIPLVLSAGFAIGDAPLRYVAICLSLAGAASAAGLVLSGVGLARTRGAGQVLSAVALLIAGALGLVTLVFAVSIHW